LAPRTGLVEHYTVKSGDALPRHDCAVESHHVRFGAVLAGTALCGPFPLFFFFAPALRFVGRGP